MYWPIVHYTDLNIPSPNPWHTAQVKRQNLSQSPSASRLMKKTPFPLRSTVETLQSKSQNLPENAACILTPASGGTSTVNSYNRPIHGETL
jgi:hypothetical protein